MLDATRTTTALLEALHDAGDSMAWSLFDARYRPIIVGFARKLGLGDADAADVAQETLAQFVKEYRERRYDRERGRLRSWLMGIAKYRVAAMWRDGARRRAQRGESAMLELPDDAELTHIWLNEHRQMVLRQALQELRRGTRTDRHTIEAFEMLVINGMSAPAVAHELGIPVQQVYLAKSRVAQRLREIVARLEAAWEEDA